MSPWYVYMIRCSDASLYTGITTNLDRRFQEHKDSKKGSRYARAKIPLHIAYTETYHSRSEAQKREYVIKQLTKAEKEILIKSTLPIKTKKVTKKLKVSIDI
jgi:putative endonuclease